MRPARRSPRATRSEQLAGRARVAVASDHALVADSVRAALVKQSYDAVVLMWPTFGTVDVVATLRARLTESTLTSGNQRPDVALLLSDLSNVRQIRGAQTLIEDIAVPWLVLADAPPGPAWGAVLACGAKRVMSTGTTLGQTTRLLDELAAGRGGMNARRTRTLVREWREYSRQREEIALRMMSLSSREEEVLRLLYLGETVRTIADGSEVTQSTVRSQVKAILRKFEVNSQIAAVAAYEQFHQD